MKRVLIIGATSAIAQATARHFASDGAQFFLTGRSLEKLGSVARDLKVRGASEAECRVLDVSRLDDYQALIEDAFNTLREIDVVLLAHGMLADQKTCEKNPSIALDVINVNFGATVSLLTILANRFEAQGNGVIAVISSVAGDRGRQSNYVYGSAKGGLTVFLQGLRNRLAKSGVAVLTIKPGFINTPMTQGMTKRPFAVDPAVVGRGIFNAILAKRDVVYVPWFWGPIMSIIRMIPERFFKRMNM